MMLVYTAAQRERVERQLREPEWYAKLCARDDSREIRMYGYDEDGSMWEAETTLAQVRDSAAYVPDLEVLSETTWLDRFRRAYAAEAEHIYEMEP